MGVGEGRGERFGFGAVLAEEGEEGEGVGDGDGFLGEGGEGAVRAELDEGGDVLGFEGADAVVEADGFADVADPEVGVVISSRWRRCR